MSSDTLATAIDGVLGAASAPALPLRIGRYVTLRKLGEGAMGEVYLTYDDQLDRRVAVKVVRAMGQASRDVYARMLREAQGLARLSHPNVVQVYEAADLDGRVYLAMEFVEGETLRTWAKSQVRGWREILDRCVEAGRGLAAAHAAGLVHRDFKPDNVMVGKDGRVRVLDFGLVRAEHDAAAADRTLDLRESSRVPLSTTTSLDSELTAAHSLIGTPAYMSPEQHLREVADARADTFAFCVTVYEMLCGVRPFAGKDQASIMKAVLQQRFAPPEAGRRVPGWVRRVILRGLAVNPGERWASMDELLAALGRDPRIVWRRVLLVGAAALAVTAGFGVAAWSVQREREACEGGAAEMEGVWDAARRSEVHAALAATGVSYAATVGERVDAGLDAYRDAWIAMHREACLDHRRGEQSGELLDQRMTCLAERRQAVRALVDLLAAADGALVERASGAIGELPRIEPCGELAYLEARVRPPDDPVAASRVAAVRAGQADARALERAGRYDDGLARIDALAAEAAEIGYRPLQIELDALRGRLLVDTGDWAGAEAVLEATFYEARALGHDAAAIEAATYLVPAVGHGRSDFVQAERWLRQADAEIRHAGEPGQDVDLLGVAAAHHILRGDYEAGLHDFERAIERRRALDGDLHPSLVLLYSGLGSALFKRGRMTEASAALERALTVGEVALGPEHPQIGHVLSRIGMIASRERRFEVAASALERALAISERSLGPEHPRVTEILSYLGELEIRRHDFGRAIAHLRRAVDLAMKVHGDEHAHVANFLGSLSIALFKAGRTEEALAAAERALAIGEARLGPEHPNTAIFAGNLGEILNDRGRFAEARPHLERALRGLERAFGESRPELGPIHRELARALLGVGDVDLAVLHARRAVDLGKGAGVEPDEVALSHYVLARTLAASHGDAAEIRALAEEARGYFTRHPEVGAGKAAEIEAWLATLR